jgi:hypothetical protein
VWPKKIVEVIENHAGPDTHAAFFEVKVSDPAVVP